MQAMDVDLPYRLTPIAVLSGHDDRVWHVAWNPTKPLLATCSADKSVRLYSYTSSPTSIDDSPSASSGSFTYAFNLHARLLTDHKKTVRSVAWSPSGSTLATGSFDSTIGIWQRENEDEDGDVGEDGGGGEGEAGWECMASLEGHETECKSVGFSASGNLLASCSRDKTVWVWEVHPDADFECMGVLMEHTQDVKSIAWHPREEILASASYDDTIKLYLDDPEEDWFCFQTLEGHTSTVWSLAWSPNGKYLASASDDCTVRIWKRVEEHRWECVSILEGHNRTIYGVSWGVDSAAGSKEGEIESLGWLASAGGDGRVNVWELEEPVDATPKSAPHHKLIARIESAHGVDDINTVVWCPRKGYESLLATAGDDGVAKVWKIQGS